LVTYGSSEVNDLAFRGMPDEVALLRTEQNALQVAVIAGADHIYTACHDVLAARISAWLKRLAGS
jgi:alpha/beta superfamily hydrolase